MDSNERENKLLELRKRNATNPALAALHKVCSKCTPIVEDLGPEARICYICRRDFPPVPHSGASGYGTDSQGRRFCYACAAELDSEQMRQDGRAVLYLNRKPGAPTRAERGEDWTPVHSGRRRSNPYPEDYEVTNWPGTLRIQVRRMRRNRHNWRDVERIDVWYYFEGYVWHGVNLCAHGSSHILRCKRTKTKAQD